MKKASAFFLFMLFAVPAWGQEKIKLGFVDIQRAISESQEGKKARQKFQAHVKKIEAELLKVKRGAERLKADLEKTGALLKPEERRNREKQVQKKVLKYQRSVRDSQEELRQKEGEMTSAILKDLEKVVTRLGKAEKFTLILERSQALYSDNAIDITDKVIDLYNNRTLGKAAKGK